MWLKNIRIIFNLIWPKYIQYQNLLVTAPDVGLRYLCDKGVDSSLMDPKYIERGKNPQENSCQEEHGKLAHWVNLGQAIL